MPEPSTIPYGYCHCGCGNRTNLSQRTIPKLGVRLGEPRRFLPRHRILRPPAERFWAKVERRGPDECWLWTGPAKARGYGHFKLLPGRDTGGQTQAHRVAWILTTGLTPPVDIFVCHHCDNPPCCNPAHLFLGTPRDNTRDMIAKGRKRNGNESKTHCKYGHEFTPDNIIPTATGGRSCRACNRSDRNAHFHRDQTHCKHGHEFTPENTMTRKRGGRFCKECGRITNKAFRDRQRTA